MIRLSRLTDYGIVLLTQLAGRPEMEIHNAGDLAAAVGLPRPTVSKILKALVREGLLVSRRGVRGGYSLARRPEEISMADIIHALEGPIAMTECVTDEPGCCDLEALCPTRVPWQKINLAIQEALQKVSLMDMAQPFRPVPLGDGDPGWSP